MSTHFLHAFMKPCLHGLINILEVSFPIHLTKIVSPHLVPLTCNAILLTYFVDNQQKEML